MICDTDEKLTPSVDWMIRKDMDTVLRIERDSFEYPWSEDDFIRCLRQRNCIGMAAKCNGQVVGFVIYALHKTRIHVLNLAVAKEYRRRGVGRRIIEKLRAKLSRQRRVRITLEVRERNLDAQLFFRAMGFRAVAVLRGYYPETPEEDAYVFQYHYMNR